MSSPPSQFALLRSRRFLPYFITQALGALNDNIFKNALAALIAYQSVKLLGLNTDQLNNLGAMLFILPFFLFAALFGQFADKFEKSRQIRRIKLLEIVIMGLATLGFYLNHIGLLLAVLFLLGFQSTIFAPIKYSILPQAVSREELLGANALVEMGTFVAILLGTVMAPILYALPASWPIWVSGAGLVVAVAGYFSSRFIPVAQATDPELRLNWNIFTETWRNVRFLAENRVVLNGVLGISWFWFFGATFLVQMPRYAIEVIGGQPQVLSFLLALFIVGISLGSLLCEKLSGRQIEIGLVPLGAFGLTLFGADIYFASPDSPLASAGISQFLASPGAWRIVMDLVLIGIFGGFYIVPLFALIQDRAAPAHRARVIAGNSIVNALFMVVAALMAMVLLGRVGFTIPQLFLLTACLNLLVAIYIFTVVPEFTMRFIVWIMIHLIYRVRASGLENIPTEGPVIVAPNHVSFVDPLLVGGMIRRPVRFVMYYRIYKIPLLHWIFRTAQAIPVAGRSENSEILENAYRRTRETLESAEVIGIFPEGAITRDGEIQPFKKGIEKIVAETPAPVVPVAIRGLWGSLFSRRDPLHKRRPHKLWSRIEILIGEPIPPDQFSAERLEVEVRRLKTQPWPEQDH